MTRLDVTSARNGLAETLNAVAYGGERVVIHRRGKDLAALIPLEDLRLLERIEDLIDVAEAERILADPKEKAVPYERVRKALGLA